MDCAVWGTGLSLSAWKLFSAPARVNSADPHSDGDSSKPKLRTEPRYGIEVANGVNARSRIRELRAEQLAFTAAELTVSVAARYDGGKVGPRSAPFAAGEPVR